MILGECVVFAAMFAAGAGAGALCAVLDVFGRAGRAARAVSDVLTAVGAGALYFVTLYLVARGVFRLYSAAAFLCGVCLSYKLCRRLSPVFRRVLKKALTPVLRAYARAEERWEARMRPLREKREARRNARRALRAEKEKKRSALRIAKKENIALRRRKKKARARSDARIVVER